MEAQKKLREMVGASIEDLPFLIEDPSGASPQRVMSELYDFAHTSISKGDVNAFVSCFKHYSDLIELEEYRNPSVDNALHFCFCSKFDSDDDKALGILKQLPPQLRSELQHPFVYPHTWIRQTNIELPAPSGNRLPATIERPVRRTGEYIKQCSGPGHFAVVEVEIAPIDSTELTFVNCLNESHNCSLRYLEGVIEGVRKGFAGHHAEFYFLSSISARLLNVRIHDVDSIEFDFEVASREAVAQCLVDSVFVPM